MGPRRSRAAPAASSSKPAKKKAASKAARDLGLTAEEETEIKEAFELFVDEDNEDFGEEVMPTSDLRDAMKYGLGTFFSERVQCWLANRRM